MKAKVAGGTQGNYFEKKKDPNAGEFSSLSKMMLMYQKQRIQSPNKIQLQTTKAYLQSQKERSPPPQICSEQQNTFFQESHVSSETIWNQQKEAEGQIYIRVDSLQHLIYFHSIEAFEGSLTNAIQHHQMGRQKTLALKIVLAQRIIKYNYEFEKLRDECLDQYSILKHRKLKKHFTEKQTNQSLQANSDPISQ